MNVNEHMHNVMLHYHTTTNPTTKLMSIFSLLPSFFLFCYNSLTKACKNTPQFSIFCHILFQVIQYHADVGSKVHNSNNTTQSKIPLVVLNHLAGYTLAITMAKSAKTAVFSEPFCASQTYMHSKLLL